MQVSTNFAIQLNEYVFRGALSYRMVFSFTIKHRFFFLIWKPLLYKFFYSLMEYTASVVDCSVQKQMFLVPYFENIFQLGWTPEQFISLNAINFETSLPPATGNRKLNILFKNMSFPSCSHFVFIQLRSSKLIFLLFFKIPPKKIHMKLFHCSLFPCGDPLQHGSFHPPKVPSKHPRYNQRISIRKHYILFPRKRLKWFNQCQN